MFHNLHVPTLNSHLTDSSSLHNDLCNLMHLPSAAGFLYHLSLPFIHTPLPIPALQETKGGTRGHSDTPLLSIFTTYH